jgi:hypothetical protein
MLGGPICGPWALLDARRAQVLQKRAAIFIGPEFGTVSRPDTFSAGTLLSRGGISTMRRRPSLLSNDSAKCQKNRT